MSLDRETRREFLRRSVAVCLLPSLVAPTVAEESPEKKLFTEWYKKTIPQNGGKSFEHPRYTAHSTRPSEWEIALLDSIAQKVTQIPAAIFAKGWENNRSKRMGYKSEYNFTPAGLDKEQLRQCAERYREELDAFYKYLGELKTPYWNIHQWTPASESRDQTHQQAHIFLMGNLEDRKTAHYEIWTPDKFVRTSVHLSRSTAGMYGMKYGYRVEGGKMTLLPEKDEPILVGTQFTPKTALGSLLAESLHAVFRRTTFRYIQEEVDRCLSGVLNKDAEVAVAGIKILHEWAQREEEVTHAIVEQYLTEYAAAFGFSPASRTHYNPRDPKYRMVSKMKARVVYLTPKFAYKAYKGTPQALFK